MRREASAGGASSLSETRERGRHTPCLHCGQNDTARLHSLLSLAHTHALTHSLARPPSDPASERLGPPASLFGCSLAVAPSVPRPLRTGGGDPEGKGTCIFEILSDFFNNDNNNTIAAATTDTVTTTTTKQLIIIIIITHHSVYYFFWRNM